MKSLSNLPADWVLPPLDNVLYLTGPTASGKSQVALHLASALGDQPSGASPAGAEIVSVDSMAVYRGMDIGTAKPSRQERQQIAHHLIDIVDPTED